MNEAFELRKMRRGKGKGKKPDYSCYTRDILVGYKPILQEIFRCLKELIPEDNVNKLRSEYNRLKLPHSFDDAIRMIYSSRAAGANDATDLNGATVYEKIQYWFSHKEMENFFSNQACNFLFRKCWLDIARRGKVSVAGRNKKKVLSLKKIEQMKKLFKDAIENLFIIARFFHDIGKERKKLGLGINWWTLPVVSMIILRFIYFFQTLNELGETSLPDFL